VGWRGHTLARPYRGPPVWIALITVGELLSRFRKSTRYAVPTVQ